MISNQVVAEGKRTAISVIHIVHVHVDARFHPNNMGWVLGWTRKIASHQQPDHRLFTINTHLHRLIPKPAPLHGALRPKWCIHSRVPGARDFHKSLSLGWCVPRDAVSTQAQEYECTPHYNPSQVPAGCLLLLTAIRHFHSFTYYYSLIKHHPTSWN